MSFITKIIQHTTVSSVVYTAFLAIVAIVSGIFAVTQNHSTVPNSAFMIALAICSLVFTLLPATWLRYYSFDKLIRIKRVYEKQITWIFAIEEFAILLLLVNVYSSIGAAVDYSGIGLLIITIFNSLGIVIGGVVALFMHLWWNQLPYYETNVVLVSDSNIK